MDKTKDKPRKLNLDIGYPPRRFGLIAIEKGFITTNDLWEALVRQKAEEAGEADPRSIGSIMEEQGRLTASQIEEVLETMKGEEESCLSPRPLSESTSRGRAGKKRKKE